MSTRPRANKGKHRSNSIVNYSQCDRPPSWKATASAPQPSPPDRWRQSESRLENQTRQRSGGEGARKWLPSRQGGRGWTTRSEGSLETSQSNAGVSPCISHPLNSIIRTHSTQLGITPTAFRPTAQGCEATLGKETPNANYTEGVAPILSGEDNTVQNCVGEMLWDVSTWL